MRTPLPISPTTSNLDGGAAPANMKQVNEEATLSSDPVVIIGGGPCGQFTAALLRELGVPRVVVLEKRAAPNPAAMDVHRNYAFGLNARGKQAISLLPDLETALRSATSAPDTYDVVVVPASGKATRCHPRIIFAPGPTGKTYKPASIYYRPRLLAVVAGAAAARGVEVEYGAAIDDITFDERGATVTYNGDKSVRASLLLGCDGVRSSVLSALRRGETGGAHVRSAHGLNMPSFRASMSGQYNRGLVAKASLLTDLYPDTVPASYASTCWSMIQGQRFTMHALPMLAEDVNAAGGVCLNISLPAEHQLWKTRDVDGAFTILDDNFPQLHGRLRDYVSPANMDSFLNGPHTTIPDVAAATSLVAAVGARGAGAALLGDAAHAVTPELGQGLNTALEDAAVLYGIVKASGGKDASVVHVLREYEALRLPDTTAFLQILRMGGPLTSPKTFQGKVAKVDLALRRKAATYAPAIFAPHAVVLAAVGVPYALSLQKHRRTTARLVAAGVTALSCVAYLVHAAVSAVL